MAQFSVKIIRLNGAVLDENQHVQPSAALVLPDNGTANTLSQTHCPNSNPKHCVHHSDSNHTNAAKTVQ